MTDLNAIQASLDEISAGRASPLRLSHGIASLMLDVSGLDSATREAIEKAIRDHLSSLSGINEIRIAQTAEKKTITIIAIASGKGGVGKSTLSTNLAVALARRGIKVGMVDADIYGPSQPRLLGSEGVKPEARDNKLVPVPNQWGVPMLSMGQLVDEGRALAWRGPMVSNALAQLIDGDWAGAGVDTLIVDLPPGTGDVQLSMVQKHKPKGAVIVSTPQDLALTDAVRAISLFAQTDIPVIGIVENMAGYACPHCGEVSDPFGQGGAEKTAAGLGVPFLGRIPLALGIRTASDAGTPPAAGTDALAQPFLDIAGRIADWLQEKDHADAA